jgi:aryl-alcohol dehydrogenase-like predicted oxidoreductase
MSLKIDSIERMILGTAQLGIAYGIANKLGRPDQETSTKIIKRAWETGIRDFDTAQGYGDSEAVLGQAFSKLGILEEVRVISKFRHHIDHLNKKKMEYELNLSLQRLKIPSFHAMMLHTESQLDIWNQGLAEIFQGFVQSQKVKNIGISIYSPDAALRALDQEGIDFIQIPGNIFDRRFEKSGVFEYAKKRNKNIYIRSIFLQGLFLMPKEEIPQKMSYVGPEIEKLVQFSENSGFSKEEIAIAFVKYGYPESRILFGIDSIVHLEKNTNAWLKNYSADLVDIVRELYNDVPDNVTNWNLWPK